MTPKPPTLLEKLPIFTVKDSVGSHYREVVYKDAWLCKDVEKALKTTFEGRIEELEKQLKSIKLKYQGRHIDEVTLSCLAIQCGEIENAIYELKTIFQDKIGIKLREMCQSSDCANCQIDRDSKIIKCRYEDYEQKLKEGK